MKTNEHNYTIRLSKGFYILVIRGKKALTQQRVELYRVKNSSNFEFFVLYICQKYIEKGMASSSRNHHIYKTKGIKWTSWNIVTDLPLEFFLVPTGGIEPPLSRVWTECFSQLSYAGIYKTHFLQNIGLEPMTFSLKD